MLRLAYLVFTLLILAGCGSSPAADSEPASKQRQVVDISTLEMQDGQTLYVPAYSEIFYADEERTWDFAITLAIHNTDRETPIVIESILYHNGDGKLVADYVDQPFLLDPLATHAVTVPRDDKSGGIGASFLVQWMAEEPVADPVVESVMISTAGQQGLSLITGSRTIAELGEH